MSRRSSGSVTDISKSSKLSDHSTLLRDDLLSIPEEEGYENSDDLEEFKEFKLPPKTGEYYYQDYNYVKPTQSAFESKQLNKAKLFDQTKKSDKSDLDDQPPPVRDASILVSGFGMKNVDSFQELLRMTEEERRKKELRKLWRDKRDQELLEREKEQEKAEALASARSDTTVTSTSTRGTRRSSSDSVNQTESATKDSEFYDKQKQLDYLLGLETEMEEEPEDEEEAEEEESEDKFHYSSSKSIRDAQRYLRAHHVFECFQFIVAHLLSANPENPIAFILNLLNKCLLYRSSLGEPPLLYEKRHIGQLFNLMDRLQAGFIDFAQYKSGMRTLGLCTYNETPDINAEDLISKETFIEEAYEAQLDFFNELLRKRLEKNKKVDKVVPATFQRVSVTSVNPPYFIPSELLRFRKKKLVDFPQDYYEA